MKTPPLSLYIHVPWCLKKCPYCDFYSVATCGAPIPEDRYVEACLRDLDEDLKIASTSEIKTIFIGGGTPSLLSPNVLKRLLDGIRETVSIELSAEITIEMNPGTVDFKKLQGFKDAGINRLSIGVQSFQNEKLNALGRIHTAEQAEKSIEQIKKTGFKNFNLDLMVGLPEQTVTDVMADLEKAVSFHPTHISWYALTLEEETQFGQHPPSDLPSEDTISEMQQKGNQVLEAAGYHHYEVSGYALSGYECQHNLNYWQFGDYLGVGAAAHGKITIASGQIQRYSRIKNSEQYFNARSSKENVHVVERQSLPMEFMMNALRLIDGFPLPLFKERTGLSIQTLDSAIQKGIQQNLLEKQNGILKPTSHGQLFLNDTILLFAPSHS